MQNRRFTLPDYRNYEYGYHSAYELVCTQLAKISDINQQCLRSGAQCQATGSKKTVIIKYLNQAYRITLPEIEISLVDSYEDIPIRDKILILHYFTRAKGTPLTNRMIAYKELAEGVTYFPTFAKRAIRPLVDYFGKDPDRLIGAAEKLGGLQTNYGDVAVTVKAFTYVPITLVLWKGDEEFPPESSILFDSTIPDYLSIEDINVLSETISWKLVRYSAQSQKKTH